MSQVYCIKREVRINQVHKELKQEDEYTMQSIMASSRNFEMTIDDASSIRLTF